MVQMVDFRRSLPFIGDVAFQLPQPGWLFLNKLDQIGFRA
jgi:hypothetical protein